MEIQPDSKVLGYFITDTILIAVAHILLIVFILVLTFVIVSIHIYTLVKKIGYYEASKVSCWSKFTANVA